MMRWLNLSDVCEECGSSGDGGVVKHDAAAAFMGIVFDTSSRFDPFGFVT